jgi:hypothetical protein
MYYQVQILSLLGSIFTGVCWGSCNYLIKKISQQENDPKKNYKLLFVLISERLSSVIFMISIMNIGEIKRVKSRKCTG